MKPLAGHLWEWKEEDRLRSSASNGDERDRRVFNRSLQLNDPDHVTGSSAIILMSELARDEIGAHRPSRPQLLGTPTTQIFEKSFRTTRSTRLLSN
jgi:hypothetical protein